MIKQIEGTKIEQIVKTLINDYCKATGNNPEKALRLWGEQVNKIVNQLIDERDLINQIDQQEHKSKIDIMMKYTLMVDLLLHDSAFFDHSLKGINEDLKEAFSEISELMKKESNQ